jgi:hypothetical protein
MEEDWRKGSVKGEVGWEKELGRRKTGCEEGQSAGEGKFFRKSSWVRGRVGRKER